jgi:uncharacterized protein related to proFAR isomerase
LWRLGEKMRVLTILALMAATSSTLLVSTYTTAQVTPVVDSTTSNEIQTDEQIQVALDLLVEDLLAQDDTKTREEAVQEAVKSLIESQPNNVNLILDVAFTVYPDSAQDIINVAVLTNEISGDAALDIAIIA